MQLRALPADRGIGGDDLKAVSAFEIMYYDRLGAGEATMSFLATIVRLTACAVALHIAAKPAHAWPSRTLRIIASAAESLSDDSTRLLRVLYANRDYLWPSAGTGRTDIHVCWENPDRAPGATAAERAAWRDARRRAVEEWTRHARVNFSGWDGGDPVNKPATCTESASGLRIVICDLPKDARCPALPASQSIVRAHTSGLKNGVRLNPTHGVRVVVHEFGHSLGFYHEEERPDAPDVTSGRCAKQRFPNSKPVTYGAYDRTSIMSYCEPSAAAPWLSPNDIAALQRFYGRRNIHSLVTPRAKCAAAHHAVGNGDRVLLADCGEANRDQAWIGTVPSPSSRDVWNLHIAGVSNPGTWCMVAARPTAGAAIQLGTCGSTGWRFESIYLVGFGGLCLDLQGGRVTLGTPIQTGTCGALGGVNQRWTRTGAGQIRYGTTNMCAAIGPDGRLRLAACSTTDKSQLFAFSEGAVRRLDGAKCLDVPGPNDAQYTSGSGLPANGSIVQEFACNTALNQKWSFSGSLRFGPDSRLCLTRHMDVKGTGLTLAQCRDDPETQLWDYYF
jgi:Ricin-type beta-trefoil lectin domain/Astacin (Peptidase family M12A)